MRLLFNNKLEFSEITTSKENLNFPVKNLVHPFLTLKYESTDLSSDIYIELNSPETFDAFFWGFSNFEFMTVEFLDSNNNQLHYLDLENENEYISPHYFGAVHNIKYINISMYKQELSVFINNSGVTESYFSDSDYIPVSENAVAGIYPPFSNNFGVATLFDNARKINLSSGNFVSYVPSGSDYSKFIIFTGSLPIGSEMCMYIDSVELLSKVIIKAVAGSETIYSTEYNVKSKTICFNVTEAEHTEFQFYPVKKNKGSVINLSIVPKHYPPVQTWAGSLLSGDISVTTESISMSFDEVRKLADDKKLFTVSTNTVTQNRFSIISNVTDNTVTLRIYGRNDGAYSANPLEMIDYTASIKPGDIITFNWDLTTADIHINTSRVVWLDHSWILFPEHFFAGETSGDIDVSYNLTQLITSEDYSNGYVYEHKFPDETGEIFLGGLSAGEAFRMPDPLVPRKQGSRDNSTVNASPYGYTMQNYIPKLRSEEYSFDGIDMETKNEIDYQMLLSGKGKPIFMDLFEGARGTITPMYGMLTSVIDFGYSAVTENSFKIKTQECK